MLRYKVTETGIINGQYGLIRKSPRIFSVSKKCALHSAHLVSKSSKRYIFNETHIFEGMVNSNLHCLRNQWELANKCPLLTNYAWDEDKEIGKAMEMALEDLRHLKNRMANPLPTFEPMEEPDYPW